MSSCDPTASPAPPAMSATPTDFNGQAWPDMCIQKRESHFFGIGDWGGDQAGGATWTNPGKEDDHGGFKAGADDWGQWYVARQMKAFAATTEPDFILNAGDAFYPGGITEACGPESHDVDDPSHQFEQMFDAIYGGPGMDGKKWLGVLGNHDYGGRGYEMGWDQQVFHTWRSDTWVLPSPVWSQLVQYSDFAVQLFFIDSNFMDTHDDPNHNICQGDAPCWGIESAAACPTWFTEQWSAGIKMMEDVLATSTADWHIVVSHFPGPSIAGQPQIKQLHEQYGIDAIFTGHSHLQLLSSAENMTYVISGGGGGVTSDSTPLGLGDANDVSLGFTDFKISRTEMTISLHTWGGCVTCDKTEDPVEQVIVDGANAPVTIYPHLKQTASSERVYAV